MTQFNKAAKQKILLSKISFTKQKMSEHQLDQCKPDGILAGNQFLLSKIFLCLVSFWVGFYLLGIHVVQLSQLG